MTASEERTCGAEPHVLNTGGHMAIRWKKDIEESLRDATASRKPILADFTAAPA